MTRDQIDAALHEDPPLADAAPLQLLRQCQAARRVIPEQIVGDEDVVADRAKSSADRLDRSLAERSREQLPDRAERAAERAAARGLDQPGRAMGETGVLLAPAIDVPAGGLRHVVEREHVAVAAVRTTTPRRRGYTSPEPRPRRGPDRAPRPAAAPPARRRRADRVDVGVERKASGYAAAE